MGAPGTFFESGEHKPVMCQEVITLFTDALHHASNPLILDATFGRGGHTQALLQALPQARVGALDRDPQAIAWGEAVSRAFPDRLVLRRGCFADMALAHPGPYHGVLFDLGVSSPQLDVPQRGFSFAHDGPLDMRMDPDDTVTAEHLVNTLPGEDLADLFFHYADERHSRKIARAIVHDRAAQPFTTTAQLAGLIERLLGRRRGMIHPATRVFQALRMAVNEEILQLTRGLESAALGLDPGGILGVISFHSTEDRVVKQFFRQTFTQGVWTSYSKKALSPSSQEVADNPRARSAHLRWGIRSSSQWGGVSAAPGARGGGKKLFGPWGAR